MCECITVVHMGNRTVLTLGAPQEMTARSVDATSGRDVNGDRLPDLVVSTWSGGAHCCYSTTIHSVGREVRPLLSIETGNCGPGEFMDLDGNGTMEFITCDDRWGYAHCSFAESPFPSVVLAYDAARGEYSPATPRYAARLRDDIARQTAEARKKLAADGGKDLGVDKCTVLQPALEPDVRRTHGRGPAAGSRLCIGEPTSTRSRRRLSRRCDRARSGSRASFSGS